MCWWAFVFNLGTQNCKSGMGEEGHILLSTTLGHSRASSLSRVFANPGSIWPCPRPGGLGTDRVEQKQPGRFPLVSFTGRRKLFFQPRKFGNGATGAPGASVASRRYVPAGRFPLAQGPRQLQLRKARPVLSGTYLGVLFSSPCTFGVKATTKGKRGEPVC